MVRSDAIAIDASRLAVDQLTGTETYTYELLSALAEIAPPERFELYVNAAKPPGHLPSLGEPVCIPFPRLWTHVRLAAELRRRRPRLLFVPAHVVPIVHPRSVVTIHDLGYLHVPEAHPPGQRRMLDLTTRWSSRAASRIIAISHATKRDLVERYAVPEAKIAVVHHGISPIFRPASADAIAGVRAKYGLASPYAVAVGTVQPRKNYGRLAEAVQRVARAGSPMTLVIAGKRGWLADDVIASVERSGANVRLLGFVPDADLPALYSGAVAACQISLYEGFGMPALEAMACGVPLIAANGSALPEVCGDAARFVDPLDVESIAEGMQAVMDDPRLRANLIERGMRRAARFTWRACAERTLAVLREAAP